MDLAERARRVYLLLDTLNDPYPQPRGSLVPDSGPAPSRYVPCESCRRRGEVRVRGGWQLCLLCDGIGWKRREGERPWDAYLEMPLEDAAALPRASSASRAGNPIGDEGFVWERLRARYDRHGSYAEVRSQLDWLSLAFPPRYRLVRRIIVEHEPYEIDPPTGTQLRIGVVQIAHRMPRVRVPGWLIEQTQRERNRTVEQLAAEGMKPNAIARELGLTRAVVRERLRKVDQRARRRIIATSG